MYPFSNDRDATIARLGEKALLGLVRSWLGDSAPPAPYGMGDDCAEIPESEMPTSLITTDSVVYGRHFDDTSPPALVGQKLLKRSLSDIAAMGGSPTQAVMAGLLPGKTRMEWLESCLRGIAGCARDHGVRIVGGDLAESNEDLALNLTLLGTGKSLLYRSGGQEGDWICVTGSLGGSLLGGHLTFTPRLQEGRLLAACPDVHSCIDISDGLCIDLLNIIPEGLSAELDPASIPHSEAAARIAEQSGQSPLWHALNDGEDHELLFFVSPMSGPAWDAFRKSFDDSSLAPVSRIGNLVTESRDRIVNRETGKAFGAPSGYDHFK